MQALIDHERWTEWRSQSKDENFLSKSSTPSLSSSTMISE